MPKRKTIGLLAYETTDQICKTFIESIRKELHKRDANLICFIGDSLNSPITNKAMGNVAYDFVRKSQLDGIIVMGGGIGQYVDQSEMEKFVSKFEGIPSTNISLALNNTASIIVDNYNGLYKLFEHLIDDHGYKKLAFVKGPEGQDEAEERFKAYKDVLAAKGIAYDQRLVAPGDFSPDAGREAVVRFIDEIGITPDVICCVDDDTALGVIGELKDKGIKVPAEIKVTGFDNTPDAETVSPPLSTVGQPLEKQAQMAVRTLFSIIEGRRVDMLQEVSTEVVIRESCGCINNLIQDALNEHERVKKVGNITDYESMIQAVLKEVADEGLDISIESAKHAFFCLMKDLNSGESTQFLTSLTEIIKEYKENDWPIDTLNRLISAFRVIIFASENLDRVHFETLLHAGRVFITEAVKQEEANARAEDYEQYFNLSFINEELNHVLDLDGLMSVVHEHFEEINIEDFMLYLDYKKSDDSFTYIGGYIDYESYDPVNPRTRADKLVPDLYLQQEEPCFILMEPLYTGHEFLGVALISLESRYVETCDQLRSHISSTVKRVFLLEEKSETSRVLEAKDQKIMSLITPMLESIKKVTELTEVKRRGMDNLTRATEESRSKIGQTNSIIRQVSDNASNMLEMSTVIDDIAENVNVLAINAAIQSSHAGKYGAAFSVIASEIRNLSDSTAENARGISENLNTVITDIKTSNETSNESIKVFTQIDELVLELKKSLEEIAGSMNELSDKSKGIIAIMQES